MKNIKFIIKNKRLTQFEGRKKHPSTLDGKTISEARILVYYNYNDEDEELLYTAFMVCSPDTDSEHFNDFLGHIKYGLRRIFESCENEQRLRDKLYDSDIVQREGCYITDIKHVTKTITLIEATEEQIVERIRINPRLWLDVDWDDIDDEEDIEIKAEKGEDSIHITYLYDGEVVGDYCFTDKRTLNMEIEVEIE